MRLCDGVASLKNSILTDYKSNTLTTNKDFTKCQGENRQDDGLLNLGITILSLTINTQTVNGLTNLCKKTWQNMDVGYLVGHGYQPSMNTEDESLGTIELFTRHKILINTKSFLP